MKTIKLLAFFLASSLVVSCSSSSDDSSTPSTVNTFNYSIDGVLIPITTITALKTENSIEVLGQGPNNRVISLKFNKFGDIGSVNAFTFGDLSSNKTSSLYFGSHYLTLNLVSIDEVNKRMTVNFNGKVYEDFADVTSPSSIVAGDFDISYSDVIPTVGGMGNSAKINGINWYGTAEYFSGGWAGDTLEMAALSDDAYTLSTFIDDNTTVGTHSFSPTSTVDKVVISRYDPITNTGVDFAQSGTGTLTVTEKTVGLSQTLISGTYSFNAIDPVTSATITITQGSFKTVYNN